MCGIVGYIGKNNPTDFLLDAIEKLEYRGYDSAGIAVCGDKKINLIKKKAEFLCSEARLKNHRILILKLILR